MRFKGHFLIVVFLVFFALLIFCAPREEKAEVDVEQIWTDYGSRMILSKDMEELKTKYETPAAKCIDQIIERNKEISTFFKQKEFLKMADKLQNWIIIPAKGELIRGKQNIERFWSDYYEKASAKGDVELVLRILYTYFNDDIKYRELKIEDSLIDFSVHVHLQFKVIVKNEGEIVQNDNGGMFGEGRHKTYCPLIF